MSNEFNSQITEWLDPETKYVARQKGQSIGKTNLIFCEEVAEQVNKDPNREAIIKKNRRNEIAVFTRKKE